MRVPLGPKQARDRGTLRCAPDARWDQRFFAAHALDVGSTSGPGCVHQSGDFRRPRVRRPGYEQNSLAASVTPARRISAGVKAVAGVEAATVALGDRTGDRRRQQQRGRRPSAEVAQAAPRGRRAGHPTNPRQMARVEAAMDVAGNCTARNRPGRLRRRLKVNGRGPRA